MRSPYVSVRTPSWQVASQVSQVLAWNADMYKCMQCLMQWVSTSVFSSVDQKEVSLPVFLGQTITNGAFGSSRMEY